MPPRETRTTCFVPPKERLEQRLSQADIEQIVRTQSSHRQLRVRWLQVAGPYPHEIQVTEGGTHAARAGQSSDPSAPMTARQVRAAGSVVVTQRAFARRLEVLRDTR
jgi:hypothetical protein